LARSTPEASISLSISAAIAVMTASGRELYCAQQVQDDERGHGWVQVHADRVHPGGVQAKNGPRLAGPCALLARLDDEVLVQQAAGDI
jgi:hypothetical protein